MLTNLQQFSLFCVNGSFILTIYLTKLSSHLGMAFPLLSLSQMALRISRVVGTIKSGG